MPLDPDVALSVRLDAICSRDRYTTDPGPVIDEIARLTVGREGVRDETVGVWAAFFRDEYTYRLCDALLEEFPDAHAYVHIGERRRGGIHSTGGFNH